MINIGLESHQSFKRGSKNLGVAKSVSQKRDFFILVQLDVVLGSLIGVEIRLDGSLS